MPLRPLDQAAVYHINKSRNLRYAQDDFSPTTSLGAISNNNPNYIIKSGCAGSKAAGQAYDFWGYI